VRVALAVVTLCAVVLATGCLSGTVEVTVEDDGSGRAVLEVFPDSDVMRQLEGVDVESLLGAGPTGSSDLQVRSIEDDGRKGYRVEFTFPDAAALGTALESGLVVAGQQVTLFSSFDLSEYDYGAWRLEATVSPAGQLITAPTDQTITEQAQALVQRLDLSQQVGLTLTIALPGKVVTSNADRTSGGSATWELDDAGASPQLTMETEPAPLVTPAMGVLIGGVLALVVGILLAAFGSARKGDRPNRRRKKSMRFGGPGPAPSSWAPPKH
jgi:hypothetical protein